MNAGGVFVQMPADEAAAVRATFPRATVAGADHALNAKAPAFPRDPQCPSPAPSPTIAEAIEQLKTAMRLDPGYAWAWHCNIAMPILDSKQGIVTHRQANVIAAHVMEHLFGFNTQLCGEWTATFGAPAQRGFDPNGEG